MDLKKWKMKIRKTEITPTQIYDQQYLVGAARSKQKRRKSIKRKIKMKVKM